MTDKEKIERIISDLENGYEINPHAIEEQRVILDMKYLINLSKSLLKNNEELRVNKRATQNNNRILRQQNKRYRGAIEFGIKYLNASDVRQVKLVVNALLEA